MFIVSSEFVYAQSVSYTYDVYGRPLTFTEYVPDGKWLQKTYGYQSGNVQTIQYTSNGGSIGTETFNYLNGNLSGISFGGVSIWTLTGENALGQPVSATTGPVTRSYGYTSTGIPTGRTASVSGSSFQNHTYNFDPQKGNLTSRRDNIANIQENFTYDILNRLLTTDTIKINLK
jgi:hypothetical protein